jgi:hypothetical protein
MAFQPTAFDHNGFVTPAAGPAQSGTVMRVKRGRTLRFITVAPVLPPTAAVPTQPLTSLPERARQAWIPERTSTVCPPGTSLELVVIPKFPVQPALPERFARPAWNPDRSWLVVSIPVWTQPPLSFLPERFIRSAWNPERTSTVLPPGTKTELVVVPGSPVQPLAPERFARPYWNPERSGTWLQRADAPPPPSPVSVRYGTVARVKRDRIHRSSLVIPLTPTPPSGNPTTVTFTYPGGAHALSVTLAPGSGFARVGSLTLLTSVPVAPPMLPERYARTVWNPDRSSVVRPLSTSLVIVPVFPVMPMLPARFARPAWNPERSFAVRSGYVVTQTAISIRQATVARFKKDRIHRSWIVSPLLPHTISGTPDVVSFTYPGGAHTLTVQLVAGSGFARTSAFTLTTPLYLIPPMAPQRFARTPWNPGRSFSVQAPWQSIVAAPAPFFSFRTHPERYAWPARTRGTAQLTHPPAPFVSYSCSLPASVHVSEPFVGYVAIANQTARPVIIAQVVARTVDPDYPAAISPPTLVDFPGLADRSGQMYKTTGWFTVPPNATKVLRFDAVCYSPGDVAIVADVWTAQSITLAAKRITTLHTTPPAIIHVLAVGS